MFGNIDDTSSKVEHKEVKDLKGFDPLSAISELKGNTSGRLTKYTRNYRRYNFTPFASLNNIKSPTLVGYWSDDQETESDLLDAPQMNVIKSCIDTLTSKIAQSKVRPYFNSFNGTYKDIKLVKQCQHFFDLFFDQQNVNGTVSNAFRDGCIFDTGWAYVDTDLNRIIRALPHQVYFRSSEMHYGHLTRIYYEQIDYPVSLLPEWLYEKIKNQIGAVEYVTYGVYYDTVHHVKAYRISGVADPIVIEYNADCVPFVYIHYCSPVLGCFSQSVVDMLNSVQLQIDSLNAKISEAAQLNPAQTFFVPEGSSIKAEQINNRVGNVIQYRSAPGQTSLPVAQFTPGFIDPSYYQERDRLIEIAYSMVGVSQLSAQSKKPRGLDAAKALLTMEDVESERFETQLNQVIRAYVDLAKVCISVFDKDQYILPPSQYRSALTWGEIQKASKLMNIQFTGADSLSKDPSTKLQQLQALAQAGVIPSTMIARYMEVPDLESGYSLATNANDAVDSVIESCLEDNNFDIPDYIPFTMLKEQIINLQLLLRSTNYKKNKDDLDKLSQLYEIAEDKEQEWQATMDQANAELQAKQAMNGDMGVNAGSVLEQEANMVSQGTPNPQASPDEVPVMPEQPPLPGQPNVMN